MIEELLKFREKLDNILRVSFCQNEELSYSQKEAFEFFINQRQNVPAEMLAKFLDAKVSLPFVLR
jgi:cullin-4